MNLKGGFWGVFFPMGAWGFPTGNPQFSQEILTKPNIIVVYLRYTYGF